MPRRKKGRILPKNLVVLGKDMKPALIYTLTKTGCLAHTSPVCHGVPGFIEQWEGTNYTPPPLNIKLKKGEDVTEIQGDLSDLIDNESFEDYLMMDNCEISENEEPWDYFNDWIFDGTNLDQDSIFSEENI